MLQFYITEKNQHITFAIDGFLEASAEQSLNACVTEILEKKPLGISVHFCNLTKVNDDGLNLIELVGTSLAKDGAKVFLSGLETKTEEALIRRGKLKKNQIFESVQDSKNAANAARLGRP